MAASPRILYTDLDGTLLGAGGSLFNTAAGAFTMAGAQALKLCRQHGVELVLVSGRSMEMLNEDARIIGAKSYIGEAGCVIVREGGKSVRINCGAFGRSPGQTVYEEIAATGAPDLLLESYPGSLEYHAPWHANHQFSHLLRGFIHTTAADILLGENGFEQLKVVDNGLIEDRGFGLNVPELHAYHLIPAEAGKGSAIALHLEMAGLSRMDAFACGDSAQDLEMAKEVSRLYLMANALSNGLKPDSARKEYENVVVTGAAMVEGFLEAVLDALAPDSSH